MGHGTADARQPHHPDLRGTNGIQALDLIRRKLLGDGGAELNALIGELAAVCETVGARAELAGLAETVRQRLLEWRSLTSEVIAACQRDPQEIGATSVDFLQYCSYVLLAGLWLQAAGVAQAKLAAGEGDADFYRAKLASAEFYVKRILPRASMHREAAAGRGGLPDGAGCGALRVLMRR